jgi:glycosyltransferase involved in cell wall biosynthesis
MASRQLRILQVSTHDIFGGAEKISWDLFQSYRTRGHISLLAVGNKHSEDPDVLRIPSAELLQNRWFAFRQGLYDRLTRSVQLLTGGDRTRDDPEVPHLPNGELLQNKWWVFWQSVHDRLTRLVERNIPGARRIRSLIWELALPGKWLDRSRCVEDFHFPGTWRLLKLAGQLPDVVHCHNLHGQYFDLRVLPSLSRKVPVILSLHDAWLLSGGCSHSFHCERWKTGCGQCPWDVFTTWWSNCEEWTQAPRYGSDYAWHRKRKIYSKSRLRVVTACRWLMQKVEQSVLAPHLVEARIIPYGVDLSQFYPGDKRAVRAALDIPQDAQVFLFIAHGLQANPAKDYATIRSAVAQVAERSPGQRILFIARGADLPPEQVGQTQIRFVPFQKDFSAVAQYYQAADVYLHAAHVDTFPIVVLEALACGTPVIATAVCGIPEQIKSIDLGLGDAAWKTYGAGEATGVLVPPKNPDYMAAAMERLLSDEALCQRLSANAVQEAHQRFDLQRQVDDYLGWYEEITQQRARPRRVRERVTERLVAGGTMA